MAVNVESVSEYSEELLVAAIELMPQLSANRPAPSQNSLEQFFADKANTLLVARVEGKMAGMTTVVVVPAIDGKLKATIEDVVVSADFRGQGVGDALVEASIAKAKERGADQLQLQSNPRREAAQHLYVKHGFEPYDTTVFRYNL
jgi:ribosomal protein S18 acetylase RimI-like enzyme